jgi:hypothetical protein
MDLALSRSMAVGVLERRAYVARCMRCDGRGSHAGCRGSVHHRARQDREAGRARPFDTKVVPPRADEPRDHEVRLVSVKTVIDLL